MNPEENTQEQEGEEVEQKSNVLTSVTPLSKYLALILFIAMPFIGGWIGYTYSPEKFIEVQKVVFKEVVKDVEVEKNRVSHQEFLVNGTAKLEVFADRKELNEEVKLVGSTFCPAPEIERVDLSLEITGQKMSFPNIYVPVRIDDLWPKVPYLVNTGLHMYENDYLELLPVIKIADSAFFIPDYSTVSVIESENKFTPEQKECEYVFKEYNVAYYHEGRLVVDIRVKEPIGLFRVLDYQRYYKQENVDLKLFCFDGCG